MGAIATLNYFGELVLQRLELSLTGRQYGAAEVGTNAAGQLLVNTNQWEATPKRGTKELIQAYNESPWLRSVVSKIGMKFAAVEWKLYAIRQSPNSRKLIMPDMVRSIGTMDERHQVMDELRHKSLLVEVTNHQLLNLMKAPNPHMSGLNARRLLMTYFDLSGDSYWILERNNRDEIKEAWPVPPHWVTDLPTPSRPYYIVSWGGQVLHVEPEDMFVLRDYDPLNPYGRGSGIGVALDDDLDIETYASKFIGQFFVNRAKPELLVSIEGASDEALKRAQQNFEEQTRGWWRAYRTFWHRGKMVVKELTQKFVDMQVSQLRKDERDTVIHVYGVPPELFGVLESSNRATVTEARKIMATEVIVPRCEIFRSEYQRQIVDRTDPRLWYDYISPVPRDPDFQLDAYKANPSSPTVGDWRRLQGLDDRGSGDNVHYVPNTVSPVDAPSPDNERGGTKSIDLSLIDKATAGDVENALEALRPERLTVEMAPVQERELRAWGQAELNDLGVDMRFDMTNPLIVEHLEDFGATQVVGINNTTREQLRRTLMAGVRAGEGNDKLAKRVQDKMTAISRGRAMTIARTESIRTANFGTQRAFEQSGIVEGKQWLSTADSRTRSFSHGSDADHLMVAPAGLNGQVRKLNEKFLSPAGHQAMQPGGFNVAEEDVNCRCTIIASFDGKAVHTSRVEAKAKAFIDEVAPWEENLLAALRRGLRKQTEDVLAVLREAAA